jgi:hypothetical protein
LPFHIGGSLFPEYQTFIFPALGHFEGIDQYYRLHRLLASICRLTLVNLGKAK